tara:strand:- start:371 stop:805 length:435 start_codon:yes stop_codon:yes gene_type:complete
MTILGKLECKNVLRSTSKDPLIIRREKLANSLSEQFCVWEAMSNNDVYTKKAVKKSLDASGISTTETIEKTVKPNFFEQDGGWYIQVRYGSRILNIYGKTNAVFVKAFSDIGPVFDKMMQATELGEFDKAMATAMFKKNSLMPV